MPALNINIKELRSKGFIKTLSGNEYLTVAGRLFLAHTSGQLLSIETEELYPDDPDFITIKATVDIYNPLIVAQIEQIAASEKLSDHSKNEVISTLAYDALTSSYTGLARSKRKGGKSAEGTNPLEVAETSAVGRALGNAGFGDTESFASFEEIMIAMSRDGAEDEPRNAPAKKSTKKTTDSTKPTAKQKEELYTLAVEKLGALDKVDFAAKIEAREEAQGKKLADFTSDDVNLLIAALTAIPPF